MTAGTLALVRPNQAGLCIVVVLCFLLQSTSGNATSNNASVPLNCSSTLNLGIGLNLLPEDALAQTLHIKASNGTLLGAFYCSGTTGLKSPITVSRVRTVMSEDSASDIISFNIIKDHSNSSIYYWILEEALVKAKQYFLISCSNAFSVYSERVSISVETERSAANTPQPSFNRIKQQYTVDVHGVVGDKAIFTFVVKVSQSGGDRSATSDLSLEVDSVSTFDLPFYIRLNSVLMLNVSNLQDVGKEAVYDVIVTARVNNSTGVGRAYTRITLTNVYIHEINEATANGTNERAPAAEVDTARIIALSVTLPLLGGLLLALIVLFAHLEVRRRRRKHRHSLQTIMRQRLSGIELINLIKSLQLDVGKEWITEWEHVQVGSVLGEGQFGEVHRGMITWQGVPPARKNQYEEHSLIPVAMKSIKGTISSSDKKAFEDEINLMVKVSGGNNPHIIKLIGCITEQFPPAILLEFALYGNLRDYLRSCRPAETDAKQSPDRAQYDSLHPFVPSDLISFTQQVASGMEYLAALGVIHRDLASRNVLLGEGKVLKIADFGLSRHTVLYVSTLNTKLPIRWMAPESIKDRLFSEKSDVWAYGVTVWEICTLGGFPYHDLSNEVLVHRILDGYQMKRPTNCSDEIYNIMESCWRLSPDDRPTFSEINRQLCGLVEQSSSHDYISMLEPNEVPTDSVDTLDSEGTETVEEVALTVRT